MSKVAFYIAILFFLLLPAGALSQQYTIKRYTPSDGLSQSQVEEVFQDSRGYMWIGTRNGLSLFDGRDFTNFHERDGLVDPYVHKVLEKKNGQIVVVTKLGLSILGDKGFQAHRIFEKGSSISINNAWFGEDDIIWLEYINRDNFSRLMTYSGGSVQDMPAITSMPGDEECQSLAFDRNNDRFIIGTTKGKVWEYKDKKHRVLWEDKNKLRNRDLNNFIIVKKKGKNHILKGHSLLSLDHEVLRKEGLVPIAVYSDKRIDYFGNDRHIVIPWEREGVKKILVDRDKTVWIASEYGLYHILSFEFLNFTEEHGLAPGIWSIVEDDKHNIWFGSLEKSLQRWDGRKLENVNGYRRLNNEPFYNGGACGSDGRLLFSQALGILEYKAGSFSYRHYGKTQAEKIYCSPLDSSLLFGFTNLGLVRIKGQTEKWIKELSADRYGWITDIAAHPEGFYWIVTSKTIARLYGDSLYVYPYSKVPVRNGYMVEVDSSGTAWFGGQEGLFMHEQTTDSFRKVNIESGMETINGMALMDNNRLLLGRMDDLVILDITEWKKGSKDFYSIYDASRGFIGREVQQDGIIRDHAGNYWISCIECATKFMPSLNKTGSVPPLLNLFKVEAISESYEYENIYSPALLINHRPGSIILDHKKNSVRLHFRAVSGYAPEMVKYSYRVKGIVNDWTRPSVRPEFTLIDPEPGNYILEARAVNARGEWSDISEIELNFVPAFWQTVYFYIFISIIILIVGSLAGYQIYRYRNRKKQQKFKMMREYYRLQMGKFVQQFDPHFAFNVIASIVTFIEIDDKEKANKYIVKFSNLLRKAIDKDDFTHPLKEEINFISEYCEMQKMQMDDKLDYNFDIRDTDSLNICVPRMMIHNFVENAIKWGIRHRSSGGRIDLVVKRNNDMHIITVTDNGIGRKAAGELKTVSTGKGYNVTMNLVKVLNRYNRKHMSVDTEDLYNDKGEAAGTRVVVKIPVGFSMLESRD